MDHRNQWVTMEVYHAILYRFGTSYCLDQTCGGVCAIAASHLHQCIQQDSTTHEAYPMTATLNNFDWITFNDRPLPVVTLAGVQAWRTTQRPYRVIYDMMGDAGDGTPE